MRPTKFFMRSGKLSYLQYSEEYDYLANTFGSNTGNLLYTYSIEKILYKPFNSIEPSRYNHNEKRAEYINENFDTFILPLANPFGRKNFKNQLDDLTKLIKKLKIPTVLIGAGLQHNNQLPTDSDFNHIDTSLKSSAKDFCFSVLDKSSSIGVRGGVTKKFLEHIGIPENKITVIGCPSIYMYGPKKIEFSNCNYINKNSSYAISFTPQLGPGINQIFFDLIKEYPNYTYIPQRRDEIGVLLEHSLLPKFNEELFILSSQKSIPIKDNKCVVFTNVLSWINFLKTQEFSIGTRLHGCIAGLLAGIPSVLVCHDSRTLELADFIGIPSITTNSLKNKHQLLDLLCSFNPNKFNEKLVKNYKVFSNFLKMNNLPNLFEDQSSLDSWNILEQNLLSTSGISTGFSKQKDFIIKVLQNKNQYINRLKNKA